MTVEPTIHRTARSGVDRLITDLVKRLSPDAFDLLPLYDGDPWPRQVPQPLAALPAAALLSAVAESTARDLAAKARGAGATWAEIAHAAGITGDEHHSAAEAAYDWAACKSDQQWRHTTVSWRCATCTGHVTEQDRHDQHPADAESGHTIDCARHLADLTAHAKALDEE